MSGPNTAHRPLGKTGLQVPPIVFGTTCLGNIYEVVPDETKHAIVAGVIKHSPAPAVFDSAGKYGAGLALEFLGNSLRKLGVPASKVIINNKLGWYRVPLRGPGPTFERDVWAGIKHDAELRISYDGILQCYEQGCELLGEGYRSELVSVHDPDEYLAAAQSPAERAKRFEDILGAYHALFDLKRQGLARAVGIGAKDWRSIHEISQHVDLDWVMFANSLTVYSHPPELLNFIGQLHARGMGIFNSAVFNAGFLIGGPWFNYRKPDPVAEAPLFAWRDKFLALCKRFEVNPVDVCVQFAFAVPGIASVVLSTSKPEKIPGNLASATNFLPPAVWTSLREEGLILHFPPSET